eukprot:CAMPEP_0113535788 /NCGR_PEP_ID=MMETSP0015_2-20120614/5904_1 /TAXON_ID=2838 /ORGANISM="Odontella" /LENGTH=34 /DNA_ID=CAMNT_0000435089 /DNA_START=314 /DNA_END=415 /DNA_ORIENTATION=+ /assembly_acc=CAM_ASM_000160
MPPHHQGQHQVQARYAAEVFGAIAGRDLLEEPSP